MQMNQSILCFLFRQTRVASRTNRTILGFLVLNVHVGRHDLNWDKPSVSLSDWGNLQLHSKFELGKHKAWDCSNWSQVAANKYWLLLMMMLLLDVNDAGERGWCYWPGSRPLLPDCLLRCVEQIEFQTHDESAVTIRGTITSARWAESIKWEHHNSCCCSSSVACPTVFRSLKFINHVTPSKSQSNANYLSSFRVIGDTFRDRHRTPYHPRLAQTEILWKAKL